MQKVLIVLGAVLLLAGLCWPLIQKIGLGRLPGDVHVSKDGFSFSFPIVSCIIISVILTVILNLIGRK